MSFSWSFSFRDCSSVLYSCYGKIIHEWDFPACHVWLPEGITLVGGFKHVFYFPSIWDNPFHWLICFKMVKTTNQVLLVYMTLKVIGRNKRSLVLSRCTHGLQEMTRYCKVPWRWSHCADYFELIPGWWFGTFYIFPYIGNNIPIWHIFQRGWNHQPDTL